MTRLIAGLFVLAIVAPLAAAPVPKHLFPDAPLYFPTQPGAEWEYDDSGAKYEFVVASVAEKDGAKLVAVHLRHLGGKTTQHSITVEVTKAGVREVSNFNRRIDPPTPLVKWPAKKGDEWSAPLSLDGEKRADCHFLCAGVEEVKVPAGTFQALKIVRESVGTDDKTHQTITTWYAPDIGPVRVQYAPNGIRELVKFTPGKAPKK
jgi:hypothetical protein